MPGSIFCHLPPGTIQLSTVEWGIPHSRACCRVMTWCWLRRMSLNRPVSYTDSFGMHTECHEMPDKGIKEDSVCSWRHGTVAHCPTRSGARGHSPRHCGRGRGGGGGGRGGGGGGGVELIPGRTGWRSAWKDRA